MTMNCAYARGSGEVRTPIDALAASTTRRAHGQAGKGAEGRNDASQARERFDATMSRALQQARGEPAARTNARSVDDDTQADDDREATSAPSSSAAAGANAASPAEGSAPSAEGAASPAEAAAPPVVAACPSSAAPVAPACAAADDDGAARTLAAGNDSGGDATARTPGENSGQDDASLAAGGIPRRRIGAEAVKAASGAPGDDAGDDAASSGRDAASDAAAAASAPHASSTDSATPRATPDFAAQLAHARAASASAPFAEASRNAAAPSAAAAAPHTSLVSTPLHAGGFPAHFAAEVAVLGAAGIERAEIRLQPAELGPVRIELSLSGESTRIAFSAAQPETRQAIEQSLPILKDLLAERGLMLGDASVSDGGAQAGFGANGDTGSSDGAAAARSGGSAGAGAGDARNAAGDARRIALRRSLLDVYA